MRKRPKRKSLTWSNLSQTRTRKRTRTLTHTRTTTPGVLHKLSFASQRRGNKWNRNESTALGRPVTITGGFNPVLRALNLHPHLPLRFTQFSWLFGSHGGLLAHQCVITAQLKSMKRPPWSKDENSTVTTRWDTWRSMSVSNTTETPEQKKTTSWTSMGQETDKCPAPTNQIFSFMLGLS